MGGRGLPRSRRARHWHRRRPLVVPGCTDKEAQLDKVARVHNPSAKALTSSTCLSACPALAQLYLPVLAADWSRLPGLYSST